jgi:hypothetical protein
MIRTGRLQQAGLATGNLLNALAQQWPLFLLERKMPPQRQDGNLADFATNALAPNQPVSDIRLSGGGVVGFGLTDKHAHDFRTKSRAKCACYKILWHNKMEI